MERSTILTFHGVGEPMRELDPGEADVWVGHAKFLAILDEAAGSHQDVAITFDDGNASDVRAALPALRQRGLRATFFVVAGRLGEPEFLNSGDVAELAGAGMEIGSHGMRHRSWRGLTAPELDEELTRSRAILEEIARRSVTRAACPFGAYDRRVLRAARKSGYEHVYTSDRGVTRASEFVQPRTTVCAGDPPDLLGRITSVRPTARQRLQRNAKLGVKRWR